MVTVLQFNRRNQGWGLVEDIERQIARTISQIFKSLSDHRLALFDIKACLCGFSRTNHEPRFSNLPIYRPKSSQIRHLADQEKYET
jgi:hypothetical protein